MAKVSLQRRRRIRILRLHRLGQFGQISKLGIIPAVTSTFSSARATRGQSTGSSELSSAVASECHRNCIFSKRRSLQQTTRPPKRQMLRRYEPKS